MLENHMTKNRICRVRSSQGGKMVSSCTCHKGMVIRRRCAWLTKTCAPVASRTSPSRLDRDHDSPSLEDCSAEVNSSSPKFSQTTPSSAEMVFTEELMG